MNSDRCPQRWTHPLPSSPLSLTHQRPAERNEPTTAKKPKKTPHIRTTFNDSPRSNTETDRHPSTTHVQHLNFSSANCPTSTHLHQRGHSTALQEASPRAKARQKTLHGLTAGLSTDRLQYDRHHLRPTEL
ncbi:Hypothetical predicted protein [Pelobates cultripes]|uniref:Uncharacterized protein n=1 Tax=Pelobates cultripes TaxID=61616 RepID=A0AAD1TCC5_PELCU|nr:Hypothetical predicted protein [Pelobates cultripes]